MTSPTSVASGGAPCRLLHSLFLSYCFDHGDHTLQHGLLVVLHTCIAAHGHRCVPRAVRGIEADHGAPAHGTGVVLVEPPVDAGRVVEVAARGYDPDAVVVGEGLEADGTVLRQALLCGAGPGAGVGHLGRQRGAGGAEEERGARDELAHDAPAGARDGALPGVAAVGAEQDEAEHDGDEHHGRGRARGEVELRPAGRRADRRRGWWPVARGQAPARALRGHATASVW
jgi:hypothetical protein